MSTNYESIKTAIQASSISDAEKKIMADIFANVADENLADIALLFNEDVKWVERVNESRKMKLKAAVTGDEKLWNEILEQQKKYINDLTYGLD
jgi:hypothetical protein